MSNDWEFHGVLRGTFDGAYRINDDQFGKEAGGAIAVEDLLVLDMVQRGERPGEGLKPRLSALTEQGVLERVGRGRGTRYVLSRRLYGLLGQKGVYTRKRGLDREAHALLLLKHVQDNQDEGSRLADMQQVLPMLSRGQIQMLLRDLRKRGAVYCRGKTRAARWHPGPPA